jgi:DNA-binding GntR family transcriptional regulator
MKPVTRTPHRSSARAQTYERLRAAIVSLDLKPGERISDITLTAELGVSRTPVREAILQLADEGLITIAPQHGTFVAPISLDDVREAQFIREALEVAALQEAVDRVGDAELGELEANLEQQRAASAAGEMARFYELDEAFHRRLMDISGFPGAWRVAQRSRAHLNRVRILGLPGPEVIAQLVAQHTGIVERLRVGDAAGAQEAMREHLRLVFRHLPELERLHPDYFEAGGARRADERGVTREQELDAR